MGNVQDPARQLLRGLLQETSAVRRAAFSAIRIGESTDVSMIARRTGLHQESVQEALNTLAAKGMARLDADGRVVAVAGLSLVPAPHRLTLNGRPLYAWCALDAVGIPAALRADATSVSTCPRCGRRIEVTLESGRVKHPHVAVIWLPDRSFSRVSDDLCPEINMFCNHGHVAEWRKANGDPPGRVLSLPEAE